jgi:hypothetical protein
MIHVDLYKAFCHIIKHELMEVFEDFFLPKYYYLKY